MPQQSAALNTDTNDKLTSGYYGDDGSGSSRWWMWVRSYVLGERSDSAVTNPSSSGSVVALLKGILTFLRVSAAGLGKAEDAAHASGDTGVMALGVRRDTAAASSGTTGDYEPLQTDSMGRLRVTSRHDPLSVTHMSALSDRQIVKASAGTLHGIVGYVASGEDGWIQVHDATTLPADTAVPEISVFVAAASDHQAVNIPLPGHVCATGITLGWSTTGPTLTNGDNKMMVAAHYV